MSPSSYAILANEPSVSCTVPSYSRLWPGQRMRMRVPIGTPGLASGLFLGDNVSNS